MKAPSSTQQHFERSRQSTNTHMESELILQDTKNVYKAFYELYAGNEGFSLLDFIKRSVNSRF
jgi:hypothetical protein